MLKTLKKINALQKKGRTYENFVKFSSKLVEFTNRFYYVRVRNDTDLEGCYSKDELKAYVALPENPPKPKEEITWPNASRIFDNFEVKSEALINSEWLIAACQILTIEDKNKEVTLKFDGEGQVIVENDRGEAIFTTIEEKKDE